MAGRDLIVLGIEGNTALFADGDHYEVMGTGGVIFWKHGQKTRYTQGPLPPDVLTL